MAYLGTANPVIDQAGLPLGSPGIARRDLQLGVAVVLKNADNAQVTKWYWRIVAKPPGSAATLSTAVGSSTSFVPDIVGSYLIELKVNDGHPLNQTKRCLCAVEDALTGYRFPIQEETFEANWVSPYSGVQNTRGWADDFDGILRDVAAKIGAVNGSLLTVLDESAVLPDSRRINFGTDFAVTDNGGGNTLDVALAIAPGTKRLADVLAQPENIISTRAVQASTRDATKYGQVNLGAETVAGKGVKNNYAAIGGGVDNLASGIAAVVAGGSTGTASGAAAVVAGGRLNVASADRAGVVCGYGNETSGNNGFTGGGSGNTCIGLADFMGAGTTNSVDGGSAAIVAGTSNTCNGANSAIVAGNGGTVGGDRAFIGAGNANSANSANSAVVAGDTNAATGIQAVVVGGNTNQAQSEGSFIGAGSSNLVSGQNAACVGGSSNSVAGQRGFVGAGTGHSASAQGSAVVGGDTNTASGQESFVGGGNLCTASGLRAVIAGGRLNGASGDYSFIGGGSSNIIGVNANAVICGGDSNSTGDDYTFVGGGTSNSAAGPYAAVVGGSGNSSSGNRSFIGGGSGNAASGDYSVVGGGSGNSASSSYTSVLAGRDSLASASDAHAIGRGAQANHSGSIVIKDGAATTQASSASNEITLRGDGNIRLISSAGKIVRRLGSSTNNYTEMLQGQQSTTDATPQTVNFASIPTGADCTVTVVLKGKQNGSANCKALYYVATYTNNGGAVALTGAAHVSSTQATGLAAATVAVGISGTNLQLQFTGIAATTIRWTWDVQVHFGGQT